MIQRLHAIFFLIFCISGAPIAAFGQSQPITLQQLQVASIKTEVLQYMAGQSFFIAGETPPLSGSDLLVALDLDPAAIEAELRHRSEQREAGVVIREDDKVGLDQLVDLVGRDGSISVDDIEDAGNDNEIDLDLESRPEDTETAAGEACRDPRVLSLVSVLTIVQPGMEEALRPALGARAQSYAAIGEEIMLREGPDCVIRYGGRQTTLGEAVARLHLIAGGGLPADDAPDSPPEPDGRS